MSPFRLLPALVAGLLLAFATPAAAQGVISGQVLDDANGLAITGVAIRVDVAGLGAISDRSGRFTITGVPAGRRTVTTRYLGYAPVSQQVEVADGRTATITIRLKPAETPARRGAQPAEERRERHQRGGRRPDRPLPRRQPRRRAQAHPRRDRNASTRARRASARSAAPSRASTA
jgi:hypothetical protein